jgi:ankyrin repeat protein
MKNIDFIENEEEDAFAKQLEEELEKETNIYINNFELKREKSDEELMAMTKEEIITYKNIQISQLRSYINSLEKEKEDLINNFKITTDTLIEKIKQIEYNNQGIRPQTAHIIKDINENKKRNFKVNNNKDLFDDYEDNKDVIGKNIIKIDNIINPNNEFQRCPNCTKEFPISEYIEHSLQCLRKIFRCQKCNKMMPITEKETHLNNYQNKAKLINAIQSDNEEYFKDAIKHGFKVNTNILEENSGNNLLSIIAINNKLKFFRLLYMYSDEPDKIDINFRNKCDLTPLMICCKNNYIELSKEIIKKGGDINAKNILGDTPLRIAQ